MTALVERTADTWWVRLYAAGPIEVAKQTIRKFCLEVGLCVNVHATDYIYTGGEETGYVVELINYPRFPVQRYELEETGAALANRLLDDTFQHSILWMDPETTTWISKRKENK